MNMKSFKNATVLEDTESQWSCWATPYLIPICLHCCGIDSFYAALLAQTTTCGLRIMELPASHQQREQAEQATMVVICSKQAALRNRRDVLSPWDWDASRCKTPREREAADAEDSPFVMTSCSAPSHKTIVTLYHFTKMQKRLFSCLRTLQHENPLVF